MEALRDQFGGQPAIWIGRGLGSVVVAEMSAHAPGRSRGVVLTSLAYQPDGHALRTVVPLVNRTIYLASTYPDRQWDDYRFYTTHFDNVVSDLDADPAASLASIFRAGHPQAIGKV
jgi:pimeloyl-ACP methyl ester carboxylesterase